MSPLFLGLPWHLSVRYISGVVSSLCVFVGGCAIGIEDVWYELLKIEGSGATFALMGS